VIGRSAVFAHSDELTNSMLPEDGPRTCGSQSTTAQIVGVSLGVAAVLLAALLVCLVMRLRRGTQVAVPTSSDTEVALEIGEDASHSFINPFELGDIETGSAFVPFQDVWQTEADEPLLWQHHG
jgi:hypothetical protein